MYVATRSSVGTSTPKNSCTISRSRTRAPPTHGWMNVGLTVVVVIGGWPGTLDRDVTKMASRAVGADTVTPADAALPPCGQPRNMYLRPAVRLPNPSIAWPLVLLVASRTGAR